VNKLTKTLLSGAAISVLTAVPVVASNAPILHLMALHGGRVVNKTKMPNRGATHVTYTFAYYSSQSANAPPKAHLVSTFYAFSSTDICNLSKQRLEVPKKSIYAKIGKGTETYSLGCPNGPTTFFGDTWTNKTGKSGDTDFFVSKRIGKFEKNGTKYKETLNMDVTVFIL
jgi:hypothetical protein